MSYPRPPTQNLSPALRPGHAVILGACVALGGALVVGTFMGITSHQWTYISIVLGSLVGLVVSRAGGEMRLAAAAGVLSLAGSAAGSVVGVAIWIVRIVHVPFSLVLRHIPLLLSTVPHVIGPFGFLCWALSAVAGWAFVRSRGRRNGRADRLAAGPATMAAVPLPGAHDTGIQPMPGVTAADPGSDATAPDW